MEKKCTTCKEDNIKNLYIILLGSYFLISGIVVGVMLLNMLINFF